MAEYDYVTKKRDEVKPLPKQHMGAIKYVVRWMTKLNVAVFRASKGRLMNTFPGSGAPVCIVTTTGDSVVIRGAECLREGQEVRVIEQQLAASS